MSYARTMGFEVEYQRKEGDDLFTSISEYYDGMREVNNLLVPWEDTHESLKMLVNIMHGMQARLRRKMGTYTWNPSYGLAFNGVHIHLSGRVNKTALAYGVVGLLEEFGLTPRTATSWHQRRFPSNHSLKKKSRYKPVISTAIGTTEIRLFDVEYFWNPAFLRRLAEVIDAATSRTTGDLRPTEFVDRWLSPPSNEDLPALLVPLDMHLAPWWRREAPGVYRNRETRVVADYRPYLAAWQQYASMPLSSADPTPKSPVRFVKKYELAPLTVPTSGEQVEVRVTAPNFTHQWGIDVGQETPTDTAFLTTKWRAVLNVKLPKMNDAFKYLGWDVQINTSVEKGESLRKLSALLESLQHTESPASAPQWGSVEELRGMVTPGAPRHPGLRIDLRV